MPPPPFTFSPVTLDRHTRNEAAVLGARSFYDDPFFMHLSAEPMLRARGLAIFMRTHLAALGDTAVATARPRRRREPGRNLRVAAPGTYPLPVTAQAREMAGALVGPHPPAARRGEGPPLHVGHGEGPATRRPLVPVPAGRRSRWRGDAGSARR